MSTTISTTPALTFSLGQVVATPGAIEALYEAGQDAGEFLRRHSRLEQGELCETDQAANIAAVADGSRIFSAFKTKLDVKLWIITEADRSSTCVLLPEEY